MPQPVPVVADFIPVRVAQGSPSTRRPSATKPPAVRHALAALAAVLSLAVATGCSKIPQGRSAVDAVHVLHAKELGAGEVEDKLATEASAKFLYLFQGVAYDYSVYDEATLQRDMARVERFYRSKGFFDAHARVAHVIQVSHRHVRVEIVVDEGPATLNRNVTIVGAETLAGPVREAVRKAARSALTYHDRFDETAFKESETAVKRAMTDRGYAYATVDSEAEVDVGAHVVDYGFKIDPGPLSTFGRIQIVGLDPAGHRQQELPEGPLLRAINIRPGSPYSTAEIDSATQALLDLEVFTTVDIEPSLPVPPPADHVVPLTVKVEPTRLREITLGGGVELDEIKDDLHLVAGWEDHNFLGNLRDFSVRFKPGVVLYPYRINNWTGTFHPLPEERLTAALKQPGFIEARTDAFIRPELNVFPMLVELNPQPDQTVVGYVEFKAPVGVQRTFWNRLFASLGYTYQLEDPFVYPGLGTKDPALRAVGLSFPELVLHLDFRDNTVKPHKGIYLASTFQAAGHIFGGSANDVRIQPEVRTYVPLAHGLTFATRASVGFLWASNYGKDWNAELEGSAKTLDATDVADRSKLERDVEITYFRGFFSGGSATNRGYPLLGVSPHGVVPFLNPSTASRQVRLSCSPSDLAGGASPQCYLPVGGATLWELQNEVRADISGPLSGAVFCDMSDVSPNQGDIRLSHLHLSCGIGAAYDTPVGPIRLDIGYRVPPLQVLGFANETQAATKCGPMMPASNGCSPNGDPVNGIQPRFLSQPIAIAIGIGQAF